MTYCKDNNKGVHCQSSNFNHICMNGNPKLLIISCDFRHLEFSPHESFAF